MERSRRRIGGRFLNGEAVMKHSDQVLGLLQKQIGNAEEVADIKDTAKAVVEKWVNPLSGGRSRLTASSTG